jgi:hypothetical protein
MARNAVTLSRSALVIFSPPREADGNDGRALPGQEAGEMIYHTENRSL